MRCNAIPITVSAVCAGALLGACGDQAPSPSAPHDADAAYATAPRGAQLAAADLPLALPEPFTVRAPIDPYFINQAPELMLRSSVAADLAVQRLVTAPGVGAWHTHPGPSFAIVERGRVEITRFSGRDGCIATVYGPNEAAGSTYYEVAGQVHRASVLGADVAVEYKVRFNTPIGAPFANPAADPGC